MTYGFRCFGRRRLFFLWNTERWATPWMARQWVVCAPWVTWCAPWMIKWARWWVLWDVVCTPWGLRQWVGAPWGVVWVRWWWDEVGSEVSLDGRAGTVLVPVKYVVKAVRWTCGWNVRGLAGRSVSNSCCIILLRADARCAYFVYLA